MNTIIIALSCALVSGTMLMGMQQQLKGNKTSETLPGMLFTGKISLCRGVQLYAGRSAETYIRRTLVDSAGEAPTIHLNDVLIPIEAELSWKEILEVKQEDFPAAFKKFKACEKALPHNLLLRWL